MLNMVISTSVRTNEHLGEIYTEDTKIHCFNYMRLDSITHDDMMIRYPLFGDW